MSVPFLCRLKKDRSVPGFAALSQTDTFTREHRPPAALGEFEHGPCCRGRAALERSDPTTRQPVSGNQSGNADRAGRNVNG
jgi:hypothetical protein